MGLARIREWYDRTHTCLEFTTIDQACDFRQMAAFDVYQKEGGFYAIGVCEMLIRTGHCRNQLAASAENLKRTLLCIATDQIDDGVHLANRFLEALSLEIDHGAGAEVAHEGHILHCCRRVGSQTRATGQLDRIGSNASCCPVNEHRLASF